MSINHKIIEDIRSMNFKEKIDELESIRYDLYDKLRFVEREIYEALNKHIDEYDLREYKLLWDELEKNLFFCKQINKGGNNG